MLPRRFSVGTGFVVCSEPGVSLSAQNDVVIFDEVFNSPLHRELAAFVYPIEAVYAAVEVKGLLKSSDIKVVVKNIAEFRALAQHKRYVHYGAVPASGNRQGLVTAKGEFSETLPPRSFVFIYDVTGWSTVESFAASWRAALSASGKAHLHGVCVLSKNWLAWQKPFTTPTEVSYYSDNALLRFFAALLDSVASMPMYSMALHRYLGLAMSAQGTVRG
jgi:uncharacterized protein DUF6602